MMVGTRIKEMMKDEKFRETFLNVLITNEDLYGALCEFNSYYSMLIHMPTTSIERVDSKFDILDEDNIYINEEYFSVNDNYRVLINYFYQKRLQIQSYAFKYNEKFIDDSIFSQDLIFAPFVKTPLTNKGYQDFSSYNLSNDVSPWNYDAIYYSGYTLTVLIQEYINYCHRHHISIKHLKNDLENIEKMALIQFHNSIATFEVNEDYGSAIASLNRRINEEEEIIKNAIKSLNENKMTPEMGIIALQGVSYLSDKEIILLKKYLNRKDVHKYIIENHLEDMSKEEVCEYIIKSVNNKAR